MGKRFRKKGDLLRCVMLLAASVSPAFVLAQGNEGPVRMARISHVVGDVEWRPDHSSAWSRARVNTPLRQDAQIWAPSGTRAEIQFDDGTALRADSGAVFTLKNLYSDKNGEFTELSMRSGRAYLHATNRYSVYQVDSPDCSAEAAGPVSLALVAGDSFKVSVLAGAATLQNESGETRIPADRYAVIYDPSQRVLIHELPAPDAWDRENDARNAAIYRHDPNLPPSIRVDAGDLEDYGSWRHDPRYGAVWCPRETDPGWRPYYDGNWVWVSPFGWTWVSDEPWGWAPYHYGTWIDEPYGWAWDPGPAQQYWSPAVVSFCDDGDYVSWAPLAPMEVHYPPALAVGFSSGNWSFFFSIGGVADYYPAGPDWCAPRPWDNGFANRYVDVYRPTYVTNIYRNITVENTRFVPFNSRFGGGTRTTLTGFRNGGYFQPLARNASATFQHGRWAAAHGGRSMFSGPPRLDPTASSLSPSRRFAGRAPSRALMSRTVFRPSAARNFATRRTPAISTRTPNPGRVAGRVRTSSPMASRAWRPNQRLSPAIAAQNARMRVGYAGRSQNVANRRTMASQRAAAARMTGLRRNGFGRAAGPRSSAPGRSNRAVANTRGRRTTGRNQASRPPASRQVNRQVRQLANRRANNPPRRPFRGPAQRRGYRQPANTYANNPPRRPVRQPAQRRVYRQPMRRPSYNPPPRQVNRQTPRIQPPRQVNRPQRTNGQRSRGHGNRGHG